MYFTCTPVFKFKTVKKKYWKCLHNYSLLAPSCSPPSHGQNNRFLDPYARTTQ